MADGRHFGNIEKSRYLRNGFTDCHELLHNVTLSAVPTVKNSSFKNPRWRIVAILKNR